MKWEQWMVGEFHAKYGQCVGNKPAIREPALRARLIQEEARELCDALQADDIVEVADGMADLIYVVIGTAVSCGIDLSPIFNEVHRSNMTKDGGKDGGGKVTKGPNFSPPDIRGELGRQGWKP